MNSLRWLRCCACSVLVAGMVLIAYKVLSEHGADPAPLVYKPRGLVDSSGFSFVLPLIEPAAVRTG